MSAERIANHGQRTGQVVRNSIGMQLVEIPPGEFLMGNPESFEDLRRAFRVYELQRFAELTDECPPHLVRITRPFYLGVHEVTIGQFTQFVSHTGYRTEAECDRTGGYGYNPRLGDFEGRKPEYSWRHPGFRQEGDHPVVNITWNDAVGFCEWLSRVEGKAYRLPTEAEWEYACRAGTTSRYHCGDDPESLAHAGNSFDAQGAGVLTAWRRYALSASDGYPFTAPVGSFQPNPFGLYDMHGNVWEWCADWYAADYYAHSPDTDPPGPESGHLRVRRGGAWHSWSLYVRASFRNYNTPRSRYLNLGLRVALDEVPEMTMLSGGQGSAITAGGQ